MTPPFPSASAAAQAVKSQTVSASELVADAIARIERDDGALNAIPCRDFDRARRDAVAADKAVRDGADQPLLGVPVTIKESFWARGMPTSWGLPEFRDWRPKCDSNAVLRLRRAGAIVIGKSNVAAALADWQTTNAVFGRTNNPYDPTRTAGGSSGGGAAAISAGFSYLDVASDQAGSIRIPAHFCGVYGLRPSAGVVSKRAYAFPTTIRPSDIAEVGPIARTGDDLALAMKVLAGVPYPEALAWSLRLPQPRKPSLANLRILLLTDHPLVPTCASIRAAVRECGSRLAAEGAHVSEGAEAASIDLAEDVRLFIRLISPANLSRIAEPHLSAMIERARAHPSSDSSLSALALRSCLATGRDIALAEEGRFRAKLAWHKVFTKFDVVICPVSPTPAFCHDADPIELRKLEIDGAIVDYFDQLCWTASASLCGLPAGSFPWKLDGAGLPIGLQAIGPQFEDRTVLGIMSDMEAAFGRLNPPPAPTQASADLRAQRPDSGAATTSEASRAMPEKVPAQDTDLFRT